MVTGHELPTPTFTARLRLVPIGPRDVDDIAAMLADPLVAMTMGGVRDRAYAEDRTRSHARRWVDDGFGLWAAYSLRDNGFVGRGGAQRTELEGVDVVELGWCLRPDRWGQGLATELGRAGLDLAFGAPGVEEVVAFTLPRNAASRGVMHRLGLTYRRDCVHADLPHVLYAAQRPR
jgi:ribosomal-protein-alanine N-acetyltransferase